MNVVIVANPAAGSVTAGQVWELVRLCRGRSRKVSVRWTSGPGDACRIALAAAESGPHSVVVAVGGDGTAREVAAGLASAWRGDHEVPMLVVPAGATNSWYHTLFGNRPWQSTVDMCLAAPSVRRFDLARISDLGRLVLAGASAGFSRRAVREAPRLASHAALTNPASRYEPYPGRVFVDGRMVHSGPTLLVNVGGSRYRGDHSEPLPHAVPDDGLLDVCVLAGGQSASRMMELARTGTRGTSPGAVHERGGRVRIERTDGRPLWFEHDGEVLPPTRSQYTMDVVPSAVPVLVADAAPAAVAA